MSHRIGGVVLAAVLAASGWITTVRADTVSQTVTQIYPDIT